MFAAVNPLVPDDSDPSENEMAEVKTHLPARDTWMVPDEADHNGAKRTTSQSHSPNTSTWKAEDDADTSKSVKTKVSKHSPARDAWVVNNDAGTTTSAKTEINLPHSRTRDTWRVTDDAEISASTKTQVPSHLAVLNKLVVPNHEDHIRSETTKVATHTPSRGTLMAQENAAVAESKSTRDTTRQPIYSETEERRSELQKAIGKQDYSQRDDVSQQREKLREIFSNLPENRYGNISIPAYDEIYMEYPQAYRKYAWFKDMSVEPSQVWKALLTWGRTKPNLVLSVISDDTSELYKHENEELLKSFKEGLMKNAVTKGAWILTDGLHDGVGRLVGHMFEKDLERTHLSDIETHMSVPLIGIAPVGQSDFSSSPGYQHAYQHVYYFTEDDDDSEYTEDDAQSLDYSIKDNSVDKEDETNEKPRLDPYHTEYFLIANTGKAEPKFRKDFENYLMAEKDIPVILIVIGGTTDAMKRRISEAMENQYPIVVVGGTGGIAEEMSKKIQELIDNKSSETVLQVNGESYPRKKVRAFGKGNRLISDLDRSIMKAVLGADEEERSKILRCVSMGLTESAKKELNRKSLTSLEENTKQTIFHDAFLSALKMGRTEMAQLLLDEDKSGLLTFNKFVILERLRDLHIANLKQDNHYGMMLRAIGNIADPVEDERYLMAKIGRVLYYLLGPHYKLQYQEEYFNKGSDPGDRGSLWTYFDPEELFSFQWQDQKAWHLFLWAVLSKHVEIAVIFLKKCGCKMGASLIAFKILTSLSKRAYDMENYPLQEELWTKALKFEDIAVGTLQHLHDIKPLAAYYNMVTRMPVEWADHATPLSIAQDAVAQRFFENECCYTYVRRLWLKYIKPGAWLSLTPGFAFVAFLFPCLIKFCDDKLKVYGETYTEINTNNPHSSKPWEESLGKKLRCYYTTPKLKFRIHRFSYLLFLLLYAYFILVDLKPVASASEIPVTEWLLYVWILGFDLVEIIQAMTVRPKSLVTTGTTLFNKDCWASTWTKWERFAFFLHLHRFRVWYSDIWNQLDMLVLVGFKICLLCRFVLASEEFYTVRILYCINLMLFAARILRFGFISENLGPWNRTMYKMATLDLRRFMAVLGLIVVVFGIIFQALINPNRQLSWQLLADVLYYPYWQLFGEIVLEEYENVTATVDTRICTQDRSLAYGDPATYRLCHGFMVFIFLALYLLITNILLMNLLIAIFSHSYDYIQERSIRVWRYDFYSLLQEYYDVSWLPPPLNIPWLIVWAFMCCCIKEEESLICRDHHRRRQDLESMAFKRCIRDIEKEEGIATEKGKGEECKTKRQNQRGKHGQYS